MFSVGDLGNGQWPRNFQWIGLGWLGQGGHLPHYTKPTKLYCTNYWNWWDTILWEMVTKCTNIMYWDCWSRTVLVCRQQKESWVPLRQAVGPRRGHFDPGCQVCSSQSCSCTPLTLDVSLSSVGFGFICSWLAEPISFKHHSHPVNACLFQNYLVWKDCSFCEAWVVLNKLIKIN